MLYETQTLRFSKNNSSKPPPIYFCKICFCKIVLSFLLETTHFRILINFRSPKIEIGFLGPKNKQPTIFQKKTHHQII